MLRLPPARKIEELVPTWTRALAQADAENLKRGQDIELGRAAVVLTSPDGSRFRVVVDDNGTLSTEAIV